MKVRVQAEWRQLGSMAGKGEMPCGQRQVEAEREGSPNLSEWAGAREWEAEDGEKVVDKTGSQETGVRRMPRAHKEGPTPSEARGRDVRMEAT